MQERDIFANRVVCRESGVSFFVAFSLKVYVRILGKKHVIFFFEKRDISEFQNVRNVDILSGLVCFCVR